MSETMIGTLVGSAVTLITTLVTLYINSLIEKHKCQLEIQQKKYEVKRKKLNDIYERVKGFGFLFIHKSYIVNNLYIRKYSYDNVELDDNVILPVSRQRREEIKKSCSIGL